MSDLPIVTDPAVSNSSTPSGGKPPGYVQSRSRSGSQVLLHVLLILALASVAAIGWFVWTLHEQLSTATATLDDASNKIVVLESNLARTQGSLSEEGEDTDAALALWESETRKLWDIANKRNKDWIEDNRANVASNAIAISDLKSQLDSDTDDLVNSLARQTRQLQDLTDKLNLSVQQNSSFRQQIQQRVLENEEAIRAIDTSRIQNNNRLLDLDRRVRSLEAP